LAQGLEREGHQVSLVTEQVIRQPARSSTRESFSDQPLPLTNWILHGVRGARYLRGLEEQEGYDVVHFVNARLAYRYRGVFLASVFQTITQQLSAAGGLPYHSSLGNLAARYVYYNLVRLLTERPSFARASCLIAGSHATRKELLEHYGVEPKKVEVVWQGIDTSFFKRWDADSLRRRLNLERKKVVLYVGFSSPRKGVEYLARALNRLPPSVKLITVGRWEAGYRQRFLRALGENSSRVVDVGYVPDEEMPLYYSLADVFALPSLLEGFGLPLIEAMACQTPVVATNVGSIPEVVGDCGLLVPPRDSDALAEAIGQLLEDDALQERLGKEGRQRVEQYFTQEEMVRRTIAVYEKFARL